MLDASRGALSAKIALPVGIALAARSRAGAAGGTTSRVLARGDGWSVLDVVCTAGPSDTPYEERHSAVSIAIVASGSFEYRTTVGRALMTPGSMLLGAHGRCFECGHRHGEGDRCISFRYAPEYFERVASDAGATDAVHGFAVPRLPPLRESAALIAAASRGLLGHDVAWEELAIRVAARVARLSQNGPSATVGVAPRMERRVTEVVREMERSSARELPLARLAAMAGLSPFYFLRTFERLTGLTPHQYVRRLRLREAALRLVHDDSRVIDVAFESGFTDLSAFNRAFRAEFGISPRAYRRATCHPLI
jgi:AraC family transcriptional regulator